MLTPHQTPEHADHDPYCDLGEKLLYVISELTEVMMEENFILADGIPASLAANVDRKLELSDDYEELYAELVDNQSELLSTDPAFAHKLLEAVLQLRETASENLERLDAAMNASKLRVEAVMAAMRTTVSENLPYSATGTVPLNARLAAFGKDHHA